MVCRKKMKRPTGNIFSCMQLKQFPAVDKAKLEGEGVEDSRADYDEHGRPAIKMQMTPTGSRTWAKLTTDNVNKPIAIVLDDIVYSAPNVIGPIEGGNSEISGNFTVEEAQDLANILKSVKLMLLQKSFRSKL